MSIDETIQRYREILGIFSAEFNHQMSVIVKAILEEIHPISIYLTGSFGRNEGALRVTTSGDVSPIRDYDILVVTQERIESDKIRKLMEKLNAMLGFQDLKSKRFPFVAFTVWVTQSSLKSINNLPLLKYYELKQSSKLLWGQDIRRIIRVDIKELINYNVILILFSKIHGLLGFLNLGTLRKNMSDKAVDFTYECLKTYVEIGTCLSLLSGKYRPTFVDRCFEISANFDKLFPSLKKQSPDLPSMILYSARRRLIIDDEFLGALNLKGLFLNARGDLKMVMSYCARRLYGARLSLEELNTKVVEEVFCSYLRNRFGISSGFLNKLASEAYLRYTSLKFFILGRRTGYKIRARVLFVRQANIMMRLWLLGLMLLDSIKETLAIDQKALLEVIGELGKIVDIDTFKNISPQDVTFEITRKICLGLLTLADKVFHRKDY